MSDAAPQAEILEAVARAFAGARLARRLIDPAGEVGAAAVIACRTVPGARRASTKAQIAMEESARHLGDARDRWGALVQGLAVDLEVESPELVSRVEGYGLELALAHAASALEAARDAGSALGTDSAAHLAQLLTALAELRATLPPDPPS